jgi:hypothetical protein
MNIGKLKTKTVNLILRAFTFVMLLSGNTAHSQRVTLGAYYFDGWTGASPEHITSNLVTNFAERQPKWGWITSTKTIVDDQIKLASNAGLSFFSFCWYYRSQSTYKTEPLNQALRYYLKSKYNNRLKFSLLVVNHEGFEIGPKNWDSVVSELCDLMQHRSYLTTNDKPLLVFFSLNSLLKNFQGEGGVKQALETLQSVAYKKGLPGVSIGVCVNVVNEAVIAERCGFQILTGYNYNWVGLTNSQTAPVDSLTAGESKIWQDIALKTPLKFIPATTLNWDPRPWVKQERVANTKYYYGYSKQTAFRSIRNCINWIRKNQIYTTANNIALIYAWNEMGEGAYLTPSKNGDNMLEAVKNALNTKQLNRSRK